MHLLSLTIHYRRRLRILFAHALSAFWRIHQIWTAPALDRQKLLLLLLAVSNNSSYFFSICCSPSVCRLSVHLSVCNACALYSGGCIFQQCLYGICYLGHPLTHTENLWRLSQGNLSIGGVKPKRGCKIQRFWTYRRLYLGNSARY